MLIFLATAFLVPLLGLAFLRFKGWERAEWTYETGWVITKRSQDDVADAT